MKFTAGDKIRCLKRDPRYYKFTVGNIYEVYNYLNLTNGDWAVIKDDAHDKEYLINNLIEYENFRFELVEDTNEDTNEELYVIQKDIPMPLDAKVMDLLIKMEIGDSFKFDENECDMVFNQAQDITDSHDYIFISNDKDRIWRVC